MANDYDGVHKWVATISVIVSLLVMAGSILFIVYDNKKSIAQLEKERIQNAIVMTTTVSKVSRLEYEMSVTRNQMTNASQAQQVAFERMFIKFDEFLKEQAKYHISVTRIGTNQERLIEDVHELKKDIKDNGG